MVMFKEQIPGKEDVMFVKEDPARIYRGLKDMLVDEFDMDRIEEGHMEFNVAAPKDRVRMNAFKEKSPHTVIRYRLSMKAKSPKRIYKEERTENILKARAKIYAQVITVYPGGEPISWLPRGESEWPDQRHGLPGLRAEERTRFQRSKLYEILAGIWYNKFYSKEIERYEEEAEESMIRMLNLLRERFGVEKAVARTGASHYQPPWRR